MQLDRSTTTCISVNSRATNSKSRSKGTGSNSRVTKTPRKSSYRLSGILSLTSKGSGDRYGRTRRGESNDRSYYSNSLPGAPDKSSLCITQGLFYFRYVLLAQRVPPGQLRLG